MLHSRRLNAAGLVFRTEPNWNRRLKLKIPGTFRRQLVRPRGQRAAHHPASARVRLQAGQGRRFRRAHEVKLDEHSQARQRLPQVGRLHHLSEENPRPVDGHGPERSQHLRDTRQVVRLHRLSGARVDQAGDLRSPGRQPARREHPA